jgi:hypothetical protein
MPAQFGPIQCPQCGQQFLPVEETGAVPVVDDDELSELRIRNISNLRRGAYRSRSWLIMATSVCIVAAAKFVQITVVAIRSRLYLAAIGDALCVVAALVMTSMIGPKIVALTREIRRSRLQVPPEEPPDFSRLGDGSQRWKKLDELSGKGGP